MSASVINRLCEAEGASLTACLAIILGQGHDRRTGKLVRVGTTGTFIAAPDDETEAALDWREAIDPD